MFQKECVLLIIREEKKKEKKRKKERNIVDCIWYWETCPFFTVSNNAFLSAIDVRLAWLVFISNLLDREWKKGMKRGRESEFDEKEESKFRANFCRSRILCTTRQSEFALEDQLINEAN